MLTVNQGFNLFPPLVLYRVFTVFHGVRSMVPRITMYSQLEKDAIYHYRGEENQRNTS